MRERVTTAYCSSRGTVMPQKCPSEDARADMVLCGALRSGTRPPVFALPPPAANPAADANAGVEGQAGKGSGRGRQANAGKIAATQNMPACMEVEEREGGAPTTHSSNSPDREEEQPPPTAHRYAGPSMRAPLQRYAAAVHPPLTPRRHAQHGVRPLRYARKRSPSGAPFKQQLSPLPAFLADASERS